MTLLRQHGLKMFGTNLLGMFIATMAANVLSFLAYIVFMVFYLAGAVSIGLISHLTSSEMWTIVGMIIFMIILVLFYLVIYIVAFLPQGFTVAGSYSMVTEVVWQNRFRFNTYFKHGFSKLKAVIIQLFLIGLLFIPFLFLPILSLILSSVGAGFAFVEGGTFDPNYIGAGMIIFFILSWIPSVFFFLSVLYAPIILIAEDRGPWQSIKDSVRLTFRRFGRVLSTALVGWLYGLLPLLPYFLLIPIVILFQDIDAVVTIGAIIMILYAFLMFILYAFTPLIFQVTAVRWYKTYLRKSVVDDDNDPGPWGDDGVYGFDTFDHYHSYSQPAPSTATDTESKQPSSYPPFPEENR